MPRKAQVPDTKTQVERRDLRTLLICSVRYSQGRMTYMPSLVQDLVKQHADVLNPEDFTQFADDIDRCQDTDLGMDFDARGWRSFAMWCRGKAAENPR